MPYRTTETYQALFTVLRDALAESGKVPESKLVMFDNEAAPQNAIQQIFPGWTLKTCYFHFIKSVKDQAKKKVNKNVRQMKTFKEWRELFFGKFF